MGQSAEELKREIAGTREDLGATVDAITDHVSPGRIVARRKEQVRTRWSSARDSVMGSAADVRSSASDTAGTVGQAPQLALQQTQGRPMVAGAVAFGLGFLAAAIFPGTQTEGELSQKVQEAVQPAVEQLKQSGQEAVATLKEPAQDAAQQLKANALDGVASVKETAQGAVGDTKDAATQASQEVSDQTKTSGDNVRSAVKG